MHNQWLSGNEAGEDDKKAMEKLGNNAPNVSTHPNAYAWYNLACHFTWAQDILAKAPPAPK